MARWPDGSRDNESRLNTQNLVAIIVVMVLSVINIFGIKIGALIQMFSPPLKSRTAGLDHLRSPVGTKTRKR